MQEDKTKAEKRWQRAACGLWIVLAVLVGGMVAAYPDRWDTSAIYRDAVANWWVYQAVYTGPTGFNYLPAFLPIFGVFAWLPLAVGDILWRWVAFAGIAIGLWLCCNLLAPEKRWKAFTIITLLVLPISLSTLRNGQSSAQLAACLVLAAWCLHTQRGWLATLWLCLAIICKPLGIVAIGLAVMLYPRLWWRMTIGVLVILVAPYLFAPHGYVNELYQAFALNLSQCLDTSGRTFADLNGLLRILGFELTGIPSLIVRVVAGLSLAAGCWYLQRLGADVRRSYLWLGFTGIYIMFFTPMNEANSYVMLAPAYGLWAWWHVENGARRTAQVIAFMAVSSAVLSELLRMVLGKGIVNQFDKFWLPFMALIFLGILLKRAFEGVCENSPETQGSLEKNPD